MKRLFIGIMLLFGYSCHHRPLVDEVCSTTSALIPVAVDWSISGITPTNDTSKSDDESEYVHRVSLRFFPHDGSTPFDRYLEGDVYSGTIELPIGSYSVVVFNESIYDPYWDGVFEFVDVDDFDNFMAELVDEDEEYSTEAYKLASWSIATYEVTQAMVTSSRSTSTESTLSAYDEGMLSALEGIILQPLTCYINVTANIENLVSAQNVYCEVSGFSNSVYMASGESHTSRTLHSMELAERNYTDDENTHGSISEKRLILTKSTHEEAEFKLTFEVMLSDGTLHTPDEPLEFNVEHQLTRYASDDFDLSADFSLPEISSGINIGTWESEESVTIF